ncbi:MAG: hypothetical protein ACE5GJ_02175 [Gemmatimonadota bacterium]
MASRINLWVGMVSVGGAAIATWALPPSSLWKESGSPRLREVTAEHRRLRSSLSTYTQIYGSRRWAARIAEEMATAREGGEAGVLLLQGISPEQQEQARGRLQEELRRLPFLPRPVTAQARNGTAESPDPPSMVLGVGTLLGASPPGNLRRPFFRIPQRFHLWDTGPGGSYCFRVLNATIRPTPGSGERVVLFKFAEEPLLGVCAFLARYGLPGPAVDRWMRAGGVTFAMAFTPTSEFHPGFADYRRRLPLGAWNPNGPGPALSPGVASCLAGRKNACAALVVDPDADAVRSRYVMPDLQPTYMLNMPRGGAGEWTPFSPIDFHFIAALEEEYGPEALASFWRADGTVREAFQGAFGVDLGEWYQARIAAYVPMDPPGPALRVDGWLTSALILFLAGGVASAFARYRRVA